VKLLEKRRKRSRNTSTKANSCFRKTFLSFPSATFLEQLSWTNGGFKNFHTMYTPSDWNNKCNCAIVFHLLLLVGVCRSLQLHLWCLEISVTADSYSTNRKMEKLTAPMDSNSLRYPKTNAPTRPDKFNFF
jgi:hypothetical protein